MSQSVYSIVVKTEDLDEHIFLMKGIEVLKKQYEKNKISQPDSPLMIRFKMKIYELDVTIRTEKCLTANDILYVGDLFKPSYQRSLLMAIPGFGMKSLRDLEERLEHYGVELGVIPELHELYVFNEFRQKAES